MWPSASPQRGDRRKPQERLIRPGTLVNMTSVEELVESGLQITASYDYVLPLTVAENRHVLLRVCAPPHGDGRDYDSLSMRFFNDVIFFVSCWIYEDGY